MVKIFGYCKGQKIDKPAEETADNGLSYIKVEHKAFDHGVFVYFTDKTGVCMLVGLHEVFDPDKYGDAHKYAYERFRDRVAAKYGEYKEFDYLRDGSVLEGNHQWLKSLRKKERRLAAHWNWIEEDSTLPDGLESITITASEFFIRVEYRFDNYDAGVAAGEAIQSEDF